MTIFLNLCIESYKDILDGELPKLQNMVQHVSGSLSTSDASFPNQNQFHASEIISVLPFFHINACTIFSYSSENMIKHFSTTMATESKLFILEYNHKSFTGCPGQNCATHKTSPIMTTTPPLHVIFNLLIHFWSDLLYSASTYKR